MYDTVIWYISTLYYPQWYSYISNSIRLNIRMIYKSDWIFFIETILCYSGIPTFHIFILWMTRAKDTEWIFSPRIRHSTALEQLDWSNSPGATALEQLDSICSSTILFFFMLRRNTFHWTPSFCPHSLGTS